MIGPLIDKLYPLNDLIITSIPSSEKSIFLTFDDGPDESSTPEILDILLEKNISATFFVIGNKAVKNLDLIQRILKEGHAIGNHSKDHSYFKYFQGKEKTKRWIEQSEAQLQELTGAATVGFRPPGGICPPPLIKAVSEMKIPLYLWNVRFFDTVKSFKAASALRAAQSLKPGSIILLHDAQRQIKLPEFKNALIKLIESLEARDFTFGTLPKIAPTPTNSLS